MNLIELTNADNRRLWAAAIGESGVDRPTERVVLQMWQLEYTLLRLWFGQYGHDYKRLPQQTHHGDLGASPNRRCLDCDNTKPLNHHFFYVDPGLTGGFKTICKSCTRKNRRKNR